MVVRASADEPRRDSGDSGDSAPPPAGAYAGWWTRADAAAALAVAAERDGDDDAVRLEDASRALSPPAAPWLELLELSATFGAAGGGLAALLLQETALVALVAALPLVAYGARAKRDALARRFAAEAILEAREETECAVKKAVALGFATNVASTAATEAVRLGSSQTLPAVEAAVNKGVFAIKRDLVVLEGSVTEKVARGAEKDAERFANSIDALSRSVASASASALRAAKESGSVAGMLAKDVAASRVDAREQFELLAGLFAESAENAEAKNGDARDDVLTELGVLSETLSRLEKSLEKSESEERDERAVRDDGSTDDVSSGSEKSSAEKEKRVRDSAESLEALSRAASAAKAAAVAAERAAAAAEKASSLSASSRDESERQLTPVVAKLDAEQWALLGARLTQLETAAAAAAAEAAAEAGRAVGRVRAGVREDIRGASDALAAAAEAAGTRAEGSEPPPAPSAFPPVEPLEVEPRRVSDRAVSPARRGGPKRDDPRGARARPGAERRDERVERGDQADAFPSDFSNGLPFEFAERVAVPAAEAASASAFGRIAAEAALREDAETETRDGLPPINAAVGLTKEAAFENMQALLREKSVAKKKTAPRTKNADDANAKASAGPKNENETPIDTANENDSNEDVTSEKSDWSARPVRVSLSVGPDGRVVATLATREGEVFPDAKKNRSEAAATTDADADADADATAVKSVSARSQLDEGLASLRAARVAARDAGSNPSRMLEADADAAAAIAALETAAETFAGLVEASLSDASSEDEASSDASSSDASSSDAVSSLIAGEAAARGNLGNALLARGRLQVRLSSMAASQERRAAASGVRAGAEGAAAFHAEIAEECLVLAGRAFRKALALSSSRDDDEEARVTDGGMRRLQKTSRGAARALTGWGAALALRGSVVLQSAKNASSARAFAVSASEAASLAAAASEKYRAALELDEDETSTSDAATKSDVSNGCFTASARARLFVDWGDALRLAASASADALAASSAPGFEPEAPGEAFFFDTQRLPPPGECWARAEACYREAERWDDEGCGSDARRGLRACEDAFR